MTTFFLTGIYNCREGRAMFSNGLNLRKWISTVTVLIDVRKKVRMFCVKK
jgi:hypothetical protein